MQEFDASRLYDKTYVRTRQGLLFNVTGYSHPPQHVYGSLKYVQGKKWKAGYAAALEFLSEQHPQFVGDYIQIPLQEIDCIYDPFQRWQAVADLRSPPALHGFAIELANQFEFEIVSASKRRASQPATQPPIAEPSFSWGITDSLLWGEGHAASDIDLVVLGTEVTDWIFELGRYVYDSPDFHRPDPSLMQAPYGLEVADWPWILGRKLHMGRFRDRLFSLRTVLNPTARKQRAAREAAVAASEQAGQVKIDVNVEFQVADVRESLCFPAIYQDQHGNELVDYSVLYEGVFRVGDRVRCRCDQINVHSAGAGAGAGAWQRYLIKGPCKLLDATD